MLTVKWNTLCDVVALSVTYREVCERHRKLNGLLLFGTHRACVACYTASGEVRLQFDVPSRGRRGQSSGGASAVPGMSVASAPTNLVCYYAEGDGAVVERTKMT
jgi:hypothetical protein